MMIMHSVRLMMIKRSAFGLGLTGLAGLAGMAFAQQSAPPPTQTAPTLVSSALAEGSIGEQADGYLGVKATTVSVALRTEVDQINIKRRALYTQLAQKRNVTIQNAAATFGCETLGTNVAVGRAYKLPDGIWRVRKAGEVIALPAYCGT
jgi:uncharacterized protein